MTDAVPAPLAVELSPAQRLAIAYAPPEARGAWTALLALDRRLGRAALHAREPMLAQIRLAWWRERFAQPASTWPQGEPLLAALTVFAGERKALGALVDGWETLVGGEPDARGIAALTDARTGALLALARVLDCEAEPEAIVAMARGWTVGELTPAAIEPRRAPRLPRALRPLALLGELAGDPAASVSGWRRALRIMRLGMTGR